MRALALLMFVAATIPMAFIRPVVGLMLWILFSYMNPHRIAYGFATAFPWVMITALVTLISMSAHSEQRQKMPMSTVVTLMTLFMIWTGITALTAVEADLARTEWVRFFKILLLAYATLILVTDKQKLHWVLWTIVLSFGFWGFKGGLFTLLSGGGYHVLGPIKSFYRDNNGFALVMCMNIPLIRYLQLYETRKWIRYGLWALMGLSAVAVVGTYSRGGFLALSIVGVMLMLKSRRRAGLIVVVPILVVAVVALMPQKWFSRIDSIQNYQENKSAQGRIDSWKFATNVAIAYPITAGGFRVWASQDMWNRYGPPGAVHRAIHSIFFEVLGEQGFIGLGLFVGMLVMSWLSLSRIRKKARAGPELEWMGDLASMMQVSLIGYAAAGSLLPMPYFDLFYQMIAIIAIMQLFLRRAEAATPVTVETEQAVTEPKRQPARPAPARGPRRPPAGRRPDSAGRPSNGGSGGVQDLPWW